MYPCKVTLTEERVLPLVWHGKDVGNVHVLPFLSIPTRKTAETSEYYA